MNPAAIEETDSSQTQFWNKRWEAGQMPWDLGGIPPALLSYLRGGATSRRVLIPGCGSAYEVRAFHEAGHEVTAIEFCGAAVERARAVLGPLGDRVIQGNFFKHDFGSSRFDVIYERGFLCSQPVSTWPDYAVRMARLLLPRGKLVGLFLYGHELEPPPYPLTQESAAALLGPFFQLRRSVASIAESVPVYQGLEHWQEWERNGEPITNNKFSISSSQ